MIHQHRSFGLAWLIAIVVCVWPLSASASTTQQIIELRASDGRTVPALVTYPDGGPDTDAPIAIIHHGGPGGHPLRGLSASRWAADYFAEHGYVAISILSRISRDVIDQPFGAGVADIAGAVDWATQLSNGPIVLVGHSSGSVSSTLYMATTQDPRVKAIVHFAPTYPGRLWMPVNMGGERYAQVVARLQALVAEGRGDQPIYEDHHLAPPAPQTFTYGYLMSASTWLSWWGPDSRQDNLALFPQIHVPMLMISGDADIFVSRAYQEQLREVATASPRVDAVMLDGGVPHEFTGSEDRAAGLAFDWLSEIGIQPSPRISTRVVDLQIGSALRPGVIYEPADPTVRKPLSVMLLPDFADDILLSPLNAIGPRLAKAGYRVLIPQDVGSGWGFSRATVDGVVAEQRAWMDYLAKDGAGPVAVIAHGLAGALVPNLLGAASDPRLTGAVLIEPPTAPAAFARSMIGETAYRASVVQAQDAVAHGAGATTMIIAPYLANDEAADPHRWLSHMADGYLSFWGPSAPPAPVPALRTADRPVLMIDAGQGRFGDRAAQTAQARRTGAVSVWYDEVAQPFEASDRLVADLTDWLAEVTPPSSRPWRRR